MLIGSREFSRFARVYAREEVVRCGVPEGLMLAWLAMWDPFRGRIPFEEGPLAPSIEAATARVAVRCGYRFRQVATIESN